MRSILLSLLLLTSMPVAQVVCGDCNGDGSVNVLDALLAAQHDLQLAYVPPLHYSSCDVNSTGEINVLDALILGLTAAGVNAPLACPPQFPTFPYGIFTHSDLILADPLFMDSYDSALGSYAPLPPPPGSQFTRPWQGSEGGARTNGLLQFSSPASELHGALGYWGATALVAGTTEMPPLQVAAPIVYQPIPPGEFLSARAVNDNDLINAQSTADPWYIPGGPYDPNLRDLNAWLPGSTARLGDPSGRLSVYYFTWVSQAFEGVVEIIGPVVIYLDGDWYTDNTDGVANLRCLVPPSDVLILASQANQWIEIDSEPGFGAGIYAPAGHVTIMSPEFWGAIVADQLETNGSLDFHYDEALQAP